MSIKTAHLTEGKHMAIVKPTTPLDTSNGMEELKKDLFIALEMLNGYTEQEAIKNWECEHGKCQCT